MVRAERNTGRAGGETDAGDFEIPLFQMAPACRRLHYRPNDLQAASAPKPLWWQLHNLLSVQQDSLRLPSKQFPGRAHREFISTCFYFAGAAPSLACWLQKDKCFLSAQEGGARGHKHHPDGKAKGISAEKIFIIRAFETPHTPLPREPLVIVIKYL